MESPASNNLPFFDENSPLSNQLTARRLNSIISEIRANKPRDGIGYKLTRSSGGTTHDIIKPRIPRAIYYHNYSVIDASSGSSAGINVTPGNHNDSGSGMTITPTIKGTPINTIPSPILQIVNSIPTGCVYFWGTATAGSTSAIGISEGVTVPTSSTTGNDWYQLAAYITTTTGSDAQVISLEGGVGGSQADQSCAGVWLFGLV